MSESDIWGLGSRTPGRTLIVGSGKLGARLGTRLLADGGTVTAIRRRPEGLPDGFEVIEADLRHPLDRELPEFDSIVITLPPGGTGGEDSLYPSALTGVADALVTPASRTVFVSSTRVFEGRAGSTPLTEQDAPASLGARADDLLEGERLARELFGAAIVRPSGIYGPGRDYLVRRVTESAPVDWTRRTNRIHETDLVRLLEVILRAQEPPELVHATDREPVLLGDVVTHISAGLGVEPPPRLEPAEGGGTVLDGGLLARLLGSLEYPTFREGYDEMIREVRAQKE